MRAELETTSPINRDELLGLLDSTRGGEQRITAEIEVPVLDSELLLDDPPPGEPPLTDFIIDFRDSVPRLRYVDRSQMIVGGFALTFALGVAFVLLI